MFLSAGRDADDGRHAFARDENSGARTRQADHAGVGHGEEVPLNRQRQVAVSRGKPRGLGAPGPSLDDVAQTLDSRARRRV
jgi:hypothetical protein